jgi:hypothetical protein
MKRINKIKKLGTTARRAAKHELKGILSYRSPSTKAKVIARRVTPSGTKLKIQRTEPNWTLLKKTKSSDSWQRIMSNKDPRFLITMMRMQR